MDSILNFMGQVGTAILPIFVFLTMFNVGINRKVGDFTEYVDEWPFFLRMILINLVAAPIVMWLLLQVVTLSQPLEVGLLIFSMVAGAPFVIKLTQYSEHDLVLGATLLVVLIFGTSVVMPLISSIILPEIEINAWQLSTTLIRQLILPIIIGLVFHHFIPKLTILIRPWVAKLSNITLWVVVVGILLGELRGIIEIMGEGAILLSIVFILIVTVLGYFSGGHNEKDHLQDIGALGTGQRNTAAGMIIATTNFSDTPEILLIITIANTLGIIMLVMIAKFLSKDNQEEIMNI